MKLKYWAAAFLTLVLTACGNGSSLQLAGSPASSAPSITEQPTDQTVLTGATASFSVTATGTAPLSYQWMKDGAAISGATSATYTTLPTVAGDTGTQFSVTVTNSVGSTTSESVTLTVQAAPVAPSIITQPTNQSVITGATATFTVVAGGTAPLSYQWFKGATAIAGATSASYTTPATVSGDNGTSFSVTVTNSVGQKSSDAVTLTVTAAATAPTIVTQPANRTVTAGQTASFTVVAGGTAPFTYQWFKGSTAISGATSATYTTPVTAVADSASTFKVTVTNSAGNVTSNPATLTVTAAPVAPTVATQPTNQSVVAGQTATFTVVASGTAPLSYQWFKGTTAITGATAASYTTTATVTGDSGSTFKVTITNNQGSVSSNVVTLTVTAAPVAPSITTQPANQSVTAGQTATFTVVAGGTAPFTYQWFKGTTSIAGATSATYTTPATAIGDSGSTFKVTVTNSTGNITSSAATLTVTAATVGPSITTQPANQSVTAGQTATFTVVAGGTAPFTYQWFKGTAAISGATAASYTTPATVVGDSGSTFKVTVTNSAGNVTSSSATLTVTAAASAPTITTQPANQTVVAGNTATFSVTAGGTGPFTYQWQKGTTNISGATSASYTTPATVIGDSGSTFKVTVTNSVGNVTSNSATLTVTATQPPPSQSTDVTTYKYGVARTGANNTESVLTLSNVKSSTFGLLRTLGVDSRVDAEPLYLSQFSIGGGTHNVVYVATENASIYAFDADTGSILWQKSMLKSGESAAPNGGCGQIVPTIGVTATPVIDKSAGTHGTMYVVAMSQDAGGGSHQRIHALDLTTGVELLGGPQDISAMVAGSGPANTFVPSTYAERAALLLNNGTIYTSWTSHCDAGAYSGWVMAFDQTTLSLTSVLNVAPNNSGSGYGGSGPAIWMAGGGPAVDASGNVYLMTGNGAFDGTLNGSGFPSQGDYGNSFVKIGTSAGMAVTDYFSQYDSIAKSSADTDLGSGGLLLVDVKDNANATHQLVLGAGKDKQIYVLDRTNMGKHNSSTNSIYQQINLGYMVFSTPAYFNGTLYYAGVSGPVTAYPFSNAQLPPTPASQSANSFGYPGSSIVVSANGTSNAIVWALEAQSSCPCALHAYDASNLSVELYNSTQAGARDNYSTGSKWAAPTVADGKVFVPAGNGVLVFGLL